MVSTRCLLIEPLRMSETSHRNHPICNSECIPFNIGEICGSEKLLISTRMGRGEHYGVSQRLGLLFALNALTWCGFVVCHFCKDRAIEPK